VDRFDLLVEVILFLRLLHLALHTSLNGAIELTLFNFCFEQVDETLKSSLRRKDLQQSLLVFDRNS
jgi:hypothetical protein